MVSVKTLLAAGAAAFISTAACAADLALPPPLVPAPVEVGGWYLRGDVGVGVLNFAAFDHGQENFAFVWPASWTIIQQDIQDAAIAGFGIGYEVNNWLRLDVTGEYRTKAGYKVTGSYTEFCGGATCFDVNTGNHSAAVFMVNAYVDLGTWWCLTPYIGAGVGGAYNMISAVQDNGIIGSNGTVGFGYASGTSSSVDPAWNVQAGLTYNVTNTFKVDFNYRFLSLGSPQTGVVVCQNTPACPGAFYTLRDLTSQDFRVGLRWMLMPEPAPVMPLMSRG